MSSRLGPIVARAVSHVEGVVSYGRDLSRLEPKAAWANTIFDLKHRRDFEKIAMIGAPKWEERCVKTAATLLMHGKMRTFRPDQLNQAWHWLRA